MCASLSLVLDCVEPMHWSAAPEGLNTASLINNFFPKEQQLFVILLVSKLLLLEASSVVCLTCVPSRVKVSDTVDAV